MSERRHVLLLMLFPVAVQAAVVARFGEAMIAWDEFHYAQLMRDIGEGRPWLSWILRQHNEHRIVWTKLVMLAHAPFTSWNPMVEMYVSALLLGVIALGIWKLYRGAGQESPAWFWPVSLLLCSTAQSMNMLYGMMNCHYFTLAGMVWSLVFLTRRTWPAFGAALGAAAVALLSTLNGIIIFPAGLIVLFLERRGWARRIAWLLGSAALAIAYFVRYQTPGQNPPLIWSLRTVAKIIAATIMSLGSPLSAGSRGWSVALGVLTLVLIVAACTGVFALRKWTQHAGLIGLTVVALGSAAAIGLGRHRFGLMGVLESKYVTYTTLALIAPYLSLVAQRGSRLRAPLLAGWIAIVSTGLIAANIAGLSQIEVWAQTRRMHRYLVQNIDTQPDENLTEVYKLEQIRDLAAYLRAARLGPFREHVDALLVPRWREPMATGEILPESEIRAKVLCPVDTLHDVAVSLTPASASPERAPGMLHVGVESNGRLVAQGAVHVKDVRGMVWIPVSLAEPIRDCRDRLLGVRVWTEGGVAGSSVRTLTFPVYYAGITRQGAAVIRARDLGISFNAGANGLLP